MSDTDEAIIARILAANPARKGDVIGALLAEIRRQTDANSNGIRVLSDAVLRELRETEAVSTLTAAQAEAVAKTAEIAALRRVLADCLPSDPRPTNWLAKLAEREAILLAPSAAEPLLADIRAAVLALNGALDDLGVAYGTDARDGENPLTRALTALRRWVP